MACTHEKRWVAFQSEGGLLMVDDGEGISSFPSIEWCSECGAMNMGGQWITPGKSEPPWLLTSKTLAGVALDIERWTSGPFHRLKHEQINQLALAKDHVHRAQGFLDRAFDVLSEPPPPMSGVLESDPMPRVSESAPPPPAE